MGWRTAGTPRSVDSADDPTNTNRATTFRTPPNRQRRAPHQGAAEEALRASGLSWTIVRPTAYLETWLGIIGGPLVKSGTARIFGRGQSPINFVSARDVARVVELAILDPSLRQSAIEVPDPRTSPSTTSPMSSNPSPV